MISFDKDSVYLITGASSGIGRATALLFNKLGAVVIAHGRDEVKLEKLKAEALYPENIYLEARDLSQEIDELPKWVKSLKDKYGKLSGLVCCAGIYEKRPLNLIDYECMHSMMNIHYYAPVLLAKGFSDRRVNVGNNCSIIFISSISALQSYKGLIEYGAAKSALISAGKSMANELFVKNIRVNIVSPGVILTPMTGSAEDVTRELGDSFLLGQPEHVANTIAFLCSKNGEWINGQNIIIDGGSSLPNILGK